MVGGTVSIRVDATDVGVGVANVTFYIDGEAVFVDTETPYEYRWDTTGVDDGSHEIKVVVADYAGNENTALRSVVVDNTPPVIVSLVRTPEKPKAGENVTVSVEVSDATAGVEKVLLWYRVSGGTWMSVEMELEGGVWKAVIPGQAAGATVEYYVEAYDRAGNVAKSPTDSYTVSRRSTAGLTVGTMAIAGAIIVVAVMVAVFVVLKRKT